MSHYYQEAISNSDYLETLNMKSQGSNWTQVIKYKLADQMRSSMHIPDEFLEHLEVYKIVHWNVPKFKEELIDGTICISNGIYSIIYYNTTPAAAKSAKEIRLSFRKAKPEFEIEPYVLVQIVSQD